MQIKSLLVVVAVSAAPALAQAQSIPDPLATPWMDRRQELQQQRIDEGVAAGRVTATEAARLQGNMDRIQGYKDQAAADGSVSRWERTRLNYAQNRQSSYIYRANNNWQRVR